RMRRGSNRETWRAPRPDDRWMAQGVRSRARGLRAPAQLADDVIDARWQQQAVGDGRDLFGFAPFALEGGQLARERAPLAFFVRGHFERQPDRRRQAHHQGMVLLAHGEREYA